MWRYNGRKLEISVLQDGKYVKGDRSLQFPNLPIAQLIPEYVDRSKTAGRNTAMKAWRSNFPHPPPRSAGGSKPPSHSESPLEEDCRGSKNDRTNIEHSAVGFQPTCPMRRGINSPADSAAVRIYKARKAFAARSHP